MDYVYLVFTKNNKLGSRAIRVVTWSEWSHVEILTDRGTVIGANIPVGVVEVPLEERLSRCTEYAMARVPITPLQRVILFDWLRGQIGRPYDYVGLVSFFAKRDFNDDSSWFCSELVAAAFEHAASPLFRPGSTYRVTPQDIFMLPNELVERGKDL